MELATDSMISGESLVSQDYFGDGILSLKSPITDVETGKSRSEIKIRGTEIQEFLYRIPHKVEKELRSVSQLGLKETWLGKAVNVHHRWTHSVGTLNVGYIWMKILEQRVPQAQLIWPLETWDKIKAVVGTALLLHDYGHLPFAHLVNEVLESINWIPSDARFNGLEAKILSDRFRAAELEDVWKLLLTERIGKDASRIPSTSDLRELLENLIHGVYGVPWLQAIVNSPIDADKIDYIRFDSEFLRETDFPIRPRLQQTKPGQWLALFLEHQEVNHAGLLCLHGNSAIAAADLWRERIYLYDRFYLSPELRVPEKMVFEILRHYLILSTMSEPFRRSVREAGGNSLYTQLGLSRENSPVDPIELKYRTAYEVLRATLPTIEGPPREFVPLRQMMNALRQFKGIDKDYLAFIDTCFTCLESLIEPEDSSEDRHRIPLGELVSKSLVREPLVLARTDFEKAREVLRPLEHSYGREALIDIVKLPNILASPHRWITGLGSDTVRGMDYSILVPEGPVSTWGSKSPARIPLTDECVEKLERPYCRVIVIAPNCAETSKSRYIWDRVRSTLLEANLTLIHKTDEDE